MTDIETRSDIELLMNAFYAKALADDTIGFFFTEIVPLNMETHIPLIVDFWETVLLGESKYKGNVMQVHQHIHGLSAFKEAHFAKWVFLFQQTVTELFAGARAELAKQRAESIATLMRIKLLHSGIGN